MKVIADRLKIERLLTRGVSDVIEREHLKERLLRGEKLRIKFGIDPTAKNLHLGHVVVLQKLKEFGEMGHQIVLIIGDFTATVGDPSGRSETRKPLTTEEVRANMQEYLVQAGKILDMDNVETCYNSSWLAKEAAKTILEMAYSGSFQQVLRRADFKKRIDEGGDISIAELLYPLLQGYDSYMVRADVEVGGTDQLFNLLAGRRVQRHFGQNEQDILTVPLLEGLDGVRKMSKSIGNYIGLEENPDDMFGKIMSIPDELVGKYFLLCTRIDEKTIEEILALNPRDAKIRLAKEVVALCHNEEAAQKAGDNFEKLFSKKEIPDDIPVINVSSGIATIAMVHGTAVIRGVPDESNSEARRLIEQGAIEIDGEKKTDPNEKLELHDGEILKIGKRHFFRIKKKGG